jgi:hypothetical protein
MKGVAVVLGLLLLLGGGAVAAVQYAPVDLSPLGPTQEFLKSQNALYAGVGAAALGLVLFICGLLPGKKKPAVASSPKMAQPIAAELLPPGRSAPEPEPPPAAPSATVALMKASGEETSPPATPLPPPDAQLAPAPAVSTVDPRLLTRQRISDLVTINDAIKAYHAKAGAYPAAYDGLKGEIERGAHWIPGLIPDFLGELPRDPARAADNNGPQYQYVSNGSGYKLIVHGVSADGSPVEVLGVRVDPERRHENSFWAYGFWTDDFAAF